MVLNSCRFQGFSGIFSLSLPHLPDAAVGGTWNKDRREKRWHPSLSCSSRRWRGVWLPMALKGLANSSHTLETLQIKNKFF